MDSSSYSQRSIHEDPQAGKDRTPIDWETFRTIINPIPDNHGSKGDRPSLMRDLRGSDSRFL